MRLGLSTGPALGIFGESFSKNWARQNKNYVKLAPLFAIRGNNCFFHTSSLLRKR